MDGIEPLARRRRAYSAISVVMVMSVIDGSIANTALPTIARALHVGPAAVVWVINGFNLGLTAALIASAAFGTSLGLTRVYRMGVIAFTAGSVLCAVSGSLALLIAARVMQGVGAAMIMAISPALLRLIFPRAQLVRAFGWNSLIVSTAGAAGPTVGGLLLAVLAWPWLFAVNIPLAVAAVLLGAKTLPEEAGTGERPDVASVVASAIGFSLLIYGIDGFSRHEPVLVALAEAAGGAAIFGWFVLRQFRLPRPVIALDLFAIPQFASAAGTSFAAWTAWGIGFITLPFVLQLDRGCTPLISGLLLTSWPLGTALAAPFASRLCERLSVRAVASCGLAIFATGLALFALFVHLAPEAANVAFGALAGIGFGCFQAPNNGELLSAGPAEKGASAGALLATLRVAGQTLGASIVAIAFAWGEHAFGPGGDFVRHVAPVTLGMATAFAGISSLVSFRRTDRVK